MRSIMLMGTTAVVLTPSTLLAVPASAERICHQVCDEGFCRSRCVERGDRLYMYYGSIPQRRAMCADSCPFLQPRRPISEARGALSITPASGTHLCHGLRSRGRVMYDVVARMTAAGDGPP